MSAVRAALLGVVFVLELVALACVARWGWWLGNGAVLGSALALAVVVVWAAVWGVFLSPRASVPLPSSVTTFARAAMVALAAVGAAVAGWEVTAAVLVVLWLATTALLAAF